MDVKKGWRSGHRRLYFRRAIGRRSPLEREARKELQTYTMSSRGSYTTTTNILLLMFLSSCSQIGIQADECQLTPVIHVLQYPGCIPKPIPSFACTGRCTSYVQVKFIICCALMDCCTCIIAMICRYLGFWIETVANGTVLYVLPGERRTRSYRVSVVS